MNVTINCFLYLKMSKFTVPNAVKTQGYAVKLGTHTFIMLVNIILTSGLLVTSNSEGNYQIWQTQVCPLN